MTDLDPALTENRRAADDFVAALGALPPDRWTTPVAPGKWSPGQIAEHVALSYERGGDVLHGRSDMKGMPRILRPLLRRLFLSKVLATGRFPANAKTPAAFAPAPTPAPREQGIERVRGGVAAFERAARDVAGKGAAHVDHPVFGRLPIHDCVRVFARHTAHHRSQLSPA